MGLWPMQGTPLNYCLHLLLHLGEWVGSLKQPLYMYFESYLRMFVWDIDFSPLLWYGCIVLVVKKF